MITTNMSTIRIRVMSKNDMSDKKVGNELNLSKRSTVDTDCDCKLNDKSLYVVNSAEPNDDRFCLMESPSVTNEHQRLQTSRPKIGLILKENKMNRMVRREPRGNGAFIIIPDLTQVMKE